MEPICPVCNGFLLLAKRCPSCHKRMEDSGKLENFYGPYSPYVEISQLRLINGYPDIAREQCIHLLTCSHCGKQEMVAVNEQRYL